MKTHYNKGALFTDIHFGRKQNSDVHNTDCVNFIKYMANHIKKNKDIDHIIFMGDWFENRSSVNILTLNYSYEAASILNDLGLPIFFLVGNHDLYNRFNRDVYSTIFFHEFNNFKIINDNTIIPEIGDGVLLSPFLFHDEYQHLSKYKKVPIWFGHYEFNGFVVTGDNVRFSGGPDPKKFDKIHRIFSGHFHKRQLDGNICYIGNTFPMDFSDANDIERGFATYTHDTDELEFFDWEDCPKYTRALLSQVNSGEVVLLKNARVECIADVDISYKANIALRKELKSDYELREFVIKEPLLSVTIDNEDDIINNENNKMLQTSELIINLLGEITAEQIDKNLLIEIYKTL